MSTFLKARFLASSKMGNAFAVWNRMALGTPLSPDFCSMRLEAPWSQRNWTHSVSLSNPSSSVRNLISMSGR